MHHFHWATICLLSLIGEHGGMAQGTPTQDRASLPPVGIALTAPAGLTASDVAMTRSFDARGVICETPADAHTVVIRHEEIPGLMAKMTMEFNVRDTNELRGLRVGDEVTFRIKATDQESWVEGLQRDRRPETPMPAVWVASKPRRIGKLKVGDLMPDELLLAEKGRPIRLSDFRGRALAFSFIFTRCPLPDYCPRMSQNFSQARDLLLELSNGPTNWQFLSISFDPTFDTPERLSSYGNSYRQQNVDRWLFASASSNSLASICSHLDFRFADNNGSLVHNLRTFVLDPKGRLFRQFNGNEFKLEELAQTIAEAAQSISP